MFSLQDKCIIEMYYKQHILEGVNNRLTNEIKIVYKYIDSSHLNKIKNIDILLKYKFVILEIIRLKYNFYDCQGLVPKEFLKDEEFMSEIKNTKFYEIDKLPDKKDGFYFERIIKNNTINGDIKKYDKVEWDKLILEYFPEKYRDKRQLLKRKVNDKITIYKEINKNIELIKVEIKGNVPTKSYLDYKIVNLVYIHQLLPNMDNVIYNFMYGK